MDGAPPWDRVPVEIGFHLRAREDDRAVEIELERRPAQRELQPRSGRNIARKLIGNAEGVIIHRPGGRHADGPVANAAGIILDAALRPGVEHIDRRGMIRE